MGETPDTVRAEIEGTRADMSLTADAISEKVNPKQAARRQARQVRGRLSGARDTIMGSVEDMADTAQGVGGAATDQAQGLTQSLGAAPEMAKRQTQGNPLAAGLIAFGAGLLAASILPASDRERQAASRVGQAAQPAVDQAQRAAEDLKGHVQSTAQDALGQLSETARGAVGEIKQDAASSGQEVAGRVRDAAGEVRSQAQAPVSQPGDQQA